MLTSALFINIYIKQACNKVEFLTSVFEPSAVR